MRRDETLNPVRHELKRIMVCRGKALGEEWLLLLPREGLTRGNSYLGPEVASFQDVALLTLL